MDARLIRMNVRRTPPSGTQRRPPGRPQSRDTKREGQRRGERFTTRRNVVIGGERGSRQFSLRILAVVLTAIVAAIIVTPTLTSYYSQQRELAASRAELVDIGERNTELEERAEAVE